MGAVGPGSESTGGEREFPGGPDGLAAGPFRRARLARHKPNPLEVT